ncbi:glutamate racemase [Waddlia chondrophila 2032/99]|uniref:Glutamate racemase n=2 Tax=Waddlia chondrophila TaxID=71667 RepID=D6YTN8_WADCW|nr:glutamate racemase [Waddlia chondrophila]ADI37499.1 Glutamate racemase [Waddlia chondrophila WSU 86-1044]CCB90486.1 glutamate racemase [Waddlia chondrophila 2032/99]
MNAIAVFDSGLGGLTVVKALCEHLPQEEIIYFGDTARVPYGGKSRETVIRYAREISAFLLSQEIKALVIGCNTASAYAADLLAAELELPVFNVIDPLIEEISACQAEHIAVLGTAATVRSGIYQARLAQKIPNVKVTGISCPLFVPIVEEHFQNHPAARLIVEEYLFRVKDERMDTVVLGCTHYPLLYCLIREYLGDEVRIVDSASACAKQIQAALFSHPFNNSLSVKGKLKYFVSDDPERFKHLGEQFLGVEIGPVECVDLNSVLQIPQNFAKSG